MESKSAEPESEPHPTKAEADRLADLDDVRDALPSTSRAAAGDAASSDLVASTLQSDGKQPVAQSHPELMRIMQEAIDAGRSGRRHGTRETTDSHKFWSTQPMPKYEEKIPSNVNEAIEVKSVEEVKQDSYQLPGEYVWDVMDLSQTEILEELYQLLHDNYVEDDDAMFRFRYSHEFLLWALKPPHWTEQWHIGVRVNNPTRKLVGFISAVPAQIRVRGKSLAMSEVNFLCVHKKLRSKRMAVILIKEITRRCNVINVFQAVYTAGAVLPKPVGTCRYWHRSLNPQKLVDVNFSSVGKNMTIQRMKKLYKLPDEPKTPGFRKTEAKDIPAVHQLLLQYLGKFELAPEFTLEEVEHYFLPKEKIVYSYVVDGGKGRITDFTSFYSLPSTVVNNTTHDSIYAAYSYYNVASKTSWEDLMFDTIVMAKKNGFDVFNALDLMDNKQFIPQLKFGIGDGNLNYYVYNWKCSEMDAAQIGLVLM